MPATQTARHPNDNLPSFESVWATLQVLSGKTLNKSENSTTVCDMAAPNLREKFEELGLNFPKANPNASVNDKVNKIFLETVNLKNGSVR